MEMTSGDIQVQDEHERFRLFLESAPDIIFVVDLQQERVTYINRDQLFDYPADELGRPRAIFELIHKGDHASVLQRWKELSAASAGDVFVAEYRVRRKQGNWEWVQSRETVLSTTDSDQEPQILVSLSVITNRREREAAVRRYAERLHILHEIDQAIVAARSPQAIAQATLRRITRLVTCRRASVVIFNWEQSTFNVVAELPSGSMGSDDSSSLPLDWFWALDELKQGELYRAEDLSQLAPELTTQLLSWLQGQGVRSLVSVPLLAQKQLIGALNFGGEFVDSFTPEDVVVMREVAHVLAIGIGQARLYEQAHYHARKLEQRARRLLLVNDISLAVNRPIELIAVLEAAAKGLVAVIDLRQVGIALLNESRDRWSLLVSHSARRGGSLQQLDLPVPDKELVQQLLQEDSFIYIDDVARGARLAGLEELLLEHYVDNLMLVPLQVRDEVIGIIGCDLGPGVRPFSREETDLVQTIANLLSLKIEHIRLLEGERSAREETRRQLEELKVLHALATAGAEAKSADALLERATQLMKESLFPDNFGVLLYDENEQTLYRHYSYYGGKHEAKDIHFPLGVGICGHVARSGQSILVPDVSQDDRYIEADPETRSELCVPLKTGAHLIGVVNVESKEVNAYSEVDERLLSTFAHQLATAIERAGLMETLEQRVAERTRELADANEQLKELDRLKSKFVSDVSHELRTPITSLSLYLDLIERGSPEHSERYWGVLRKQTERLNRLIEDILSLSRLQMGKVDVSQAPVDLNEMVEEVLALRRDDFDAANLALEFQADETLPCVSAQPDLLAQVVANLLSNALNYTEEGAVRMSTFFDRARNMAYLSIADSGVGINAGDLPHIFERFYRGHFSAQSNIPGNGLGLTFVEEIVNLHQGRLEVESEEGVGTTFRVWLPVAEVAE